MPYPAAYGRFIRGMDPSKLERTRGSLEDDAFQGHTFGDRDTHFFRYSTTIHDAGSPSGFSDMWATGLFGINPVFGKTNAAVIVNDGVNGDPRIDKETRPKNVALLYCMKQ
jgi:hypothetical protein